MPSSEEISALLETNAFLRDLDEASFQVILKHTHIKSFADKQTIFSKGDVGDALYGVVNGQVVINTISEEGKEITLNILKKGDFFGEIALLDSQPRTANAIADGPTELLYISQKTFYRCMEEHPTIATHVIKLLCQRLRWVSDTVEDMAFLSAEKRLAKKLLHFASTEGLASGSAEIRLSQDELAAVVGVTRESINMTLKSWKANGLIELKRKCLTIPDVERLQDHLDAIN